MPKAFKAMIDRVIQPKDELEWDYFSQNISIPPVFEQSMLDTGLYDVWFYMKNFLFHVSYTLLTIFIAPQLAH